MRSSIKRHSCQEVNVMSFDRKMFWLIKKCVQSGVKVDKQNENVFNFVVILRRGVLGFELSLC